MILMYIILQNASKLLQKFREKSYRIIDKNQNTIAWPYLIRKLFNGTFNYLHFNWFYLIVKIVQAFYD